METVGLEGTDFSLILLEKSEWGGDKAKEYTRAEQQDFLMRNDGDLMPPSLFTTNLSACYAVSGDPRVARLNAKWDITQHWGRVVQAWDQMHGEAVSKHLQSYRSQLAFSCGSLRANELAKKVGKIKYQEKLGEIIRNQRDLIDDIVGHWGELWGRWVKDLSIGDHTRRYIQDHKDASALPGVKWPVLGSNDSLLRQALEAITDTYTFVSENWDDCRLSSDVAYVLHPRLMWPGQRAKSPKGLTGPGLEFSGDVDYTRIIKYNLLVSGIWAFHEDPKGCYREVFEYAASKVSPEIVCPVTEGSSIWERLWMSINDGGEYHNFDASGWDTHVPFVLDLGAPIASPFDVPQLMSGTGGTSMAGSLAQLIMANGIIENDPAIEVELLGILGDDGGWVLRPGSKVPSIPGIYEEDLDGTKLRHYLGFSMLDEERWHPCGFKVTIDRAGRGVRMQPGVPSVPQVSDYSPQEAATIVGVYIGELPDGRTTREVMNSEVIDTLDYFAPRTYREALVSAAEASTDLEGDDSGA